MSLSADFNAGPPSQIRKPPPPFSLRLSAAERSRLIDEARGVPLGTYIKAKVLGDAAPIRMRRAGIAVGDRAALAQALALLGQSRVANNLNQLAHLANIGALPFTPEIEDELRNVLECVREIRALLLQSLGMKSGGSA